MFRKITKVLMVVLMVGAFAGANEATAASRTKKSPKKTSLKQQKSRGWVSAKAAKGKRKAASKKRTAYVAKPANRTPAAQRAARKIAIEQKYANLKRALKEKQLRREEAMMRQLENEGRVAIRMENLRALQMAFQTEQEELDLQEAKGFCRDLNAECHRIPGYQLAHTADFIPSFAQDTGFRND